MSEGKEDIRYPGINGTSFKLEIPHNAFGIESTRPDLPNKVFTWEEMWNFVNLMVKYRDADISTFFTERDSAGELINYPAALHFQSTLKDIENNASKNQVVTT